MGLALVGVCVRLPPVGRESSTVGERDGVGVKEGRWSGEPHKVGAFVGLRMGKEVGFKEGFTFSHSLLMD